MKNILISLYLNITLIFFCLPINHLSDLKKINLPKNVKNYIEIEYRNGKLFCKRIYLFDRYGFIKEKKLFDSSGNLFVNNGDSVPEDPETIYKNVYNKKNNIIEQKINYYSGDSEYTKFYYNKDNQLIKYKNIIFHNYSSPTSYYIFYKYNTKNQIIEETFERNLIKYYSIKYYYDSNNNIIKSEFLHKDGEKRIENYFFNNNNLIEKYLYQENNSKNEIIYIYNENKNVIKIINKYINYLNQENSYDILLFYDNKNNLVKRKFRDNNWIDYEYIYYD